MARSRKANKSAKKKPGPLPSPVSAHQLPSTSTSITAPLPSASSALPRDTTPSLPPASAPPVAPQRRRGAKATTYVFSAAQLAHLDSLIPQFVAEVERVNPGLKPHNVALTKWKKATSKAVMDLSLFKTLVTPEKQLKAWEGTIQQRFTNYYNSTLKSRLRSQRSNPFEDITNVVSAEAPALPSKPIENTLARAMGIFSSQVPTREIFAFENPELLQAKIDEVKKRQPNLFGGALRNTALSELLESDEVSNDELETKALAMKGDVDGNQNEFPLLMTQAINNVVSRGVLGSVLTSFSYAYRNSAGGIGYGTIYNGYNAELKERIDWKFEDHEAKVAAWMSTADQILPRPAAAQRTGPAIPVNDDGVPILTEFDSMSATGRQIADVLVTYFEALWDFSKPSTTAIPWKDIASSPVKYYDTSYFKFPVPLRDPASYTEVTDLHALVRYLIKCSSSSSPFQFSAQPSMSTNGSTSSAPSCHGTTGPSPVAAIQGPSGSGTVRSLESANPDERAPDRTLQEDSHPEVNLSELPNDLVPSISQPLLPPRSASSPSTSETNVGKKKVKGKKATRTDTPSSAPPTRKSTRVPAAVPEKRKADASVGPAKKLKHSWVTLTEDADGSLWDQQGRRCDSKGNPL